MSATWPDDLARASRWRTSPIVRGQAEVAVQRAADLARQAQGPPLALHHGDGFDGGSRGGDAVLDRAVLRLHAGLDRPAVDAGFGGEPRPQGQRKVGPHRRVEGPSRVEPAEHLPRVERRHAVRGEDRGQTRPIETVQVGRRWRRTEAIDDIRRESSTAAPET